MSEYRALVADLRDADQANWKRLSLDAAAAIEALQAEVEKWQDIAYQDSIKQMEQQERIWELEAEVERLKEK